VVLCFLFTSVLSPRYSVLISVFPSTFCDSLFIPTFRNFFSHFRIPPSDFKRFPLPHSNFRLPNSHLLNFFLSSVPSHLTSVVSPQSITLCYLPHAMLSLKRSAPQVKCSSSAALHLSFPTFSPSHLLTFSTSHLLNFSASIFPPSEFKSFHRSRKVLFGNRGKSLAFSHSFNGPLFFGAALLCVYQLMTGRLIL
jgi:hypothetical protein